MCMPLQVNSVFFSNSFQLYASNTSFPFLSLVPVSSTVMPPDIVILEKSSLLQEGKLHEKIKNLKIYVSGQPFFKVYNVTFWCSMCYSKSECC